MTFIRFVLFMFLVPVSGLAGNVSAFSCPTFPLTVPTITGSDTACTGTMSYVYYTEENMYDYIWTVSSGGSITSGEWSHSITVTWSVAGPQTVSVIYDGAASQAVMDVTVISPVDIGISLSVSSNPVCAGSTATFTATVTNGGNSPDYQWRVNGVDVGTNSPTFSYVPDNGNLVTCQVLSDLPCTNGNPVTSSPIIMSVSQNVPVSVTIAASSNPTCTGSPVTFTAIPVNEGPGPWYQWKVNGIDAGSNSPIYTYTPVNGHVVTCVLTSNIACPSGNPATSNPIVMAVSPSLPVSVSVSPSANPSCSGNQVTFTATPVNGGSSPGFEWLINGVTSGNGTTLTYSPINGDLVVCKLTSSAGCATGNPATSNTVSMTVLDFVPVSVTISASENPVCSGTPVTLTATTSNGGTNPSYQWLVNGITIVNNNPSYTYYPDNGDMVICQVTSNGLCVSGNPATSNVVTMTVTPTLPPSVSISASLNPACQGTPVQFTASTINAGMNPMYQWFVDDVPAGENSAVFTFVPADGNLVKCKVTSADLCSSGQVVVSNEILMIVSPGLPVGVTIEASANPTCTGSQVTFTSAVTNGGANPTYDWYGNSVALNIHTPTLNYIPSNNEVITLKVTSDLSCATGNPGISNPVTMTVSAALPVGVSISPSSNPSCQGQTVTFSATPVNEGPNPVYQWVVNGVNMGDNQPELSYNPTNGDSIVCHLTSNFPCATGNPASSNKIYMTVNPYLPVTINITSSSPGNISCQGYQVTYTANTINAGSNPFYQWKVNNLNAGNNQSTFTYVPANGDLITCVLTPGILCPVTSPVTSNTIIQTVMPIVPAGISITASGNPVCTGTQVTFTPVVTNGGSSPALQWFINGILAGNSPLLIYTPDNGDVIACRLTSNLTCVSGNPVMSNSITMVVSSSLPLSATITASANPFCQGANVTFNATAVNAGNAPAYQWKVNGTNKGTSPVYTYPPVDGDFVTCSVTSSLWCANPNPAQSNPLLMKVNTSTPAGISITASSNPVCSGTAVTFTATAVNGGSSPVYKWKKNRVVVGTNSPVHTYIPLNQDTITCTLTSNAPCVSGNPVTSAPVIMEVSSAIPAAIYISTETNPFCAGDSVSFAAVPVNGGTSPAYQWKVNGVDKGSGSIYFKYPPLDGDQVSCWMTSNSTCISGPNPVQSNVLTMNTAASLPVGVSIVVSANPVCQGTAVTFTASPENGGENPGYQWKIDGANVGTNNRTFVYSNPVNGKTITCVMTSDLSCAAGNPATSNAITMTVNPPDPVSVTIAASSNPVCLGTLETFTASPVNGGTSPHFKWRVNGIVVDTSGPSYSYTPVDGDMVTCQLLSNQTCISGNPAISNPIVISVSQELPVSVTIQASANPFCIGQNVTFTAFPVNGGTAPFYEWFVNDNPSGTNSSTYTYIPQPGDIIKCRLTSNQACICNNPAVSDPITMVESVNMPVSCSITASMNPVCAGTNVVFAATAVNGGSNPHYQWKVNGAPVGSNSNAHQYPPANGDVVTCVVTSNLTCATNNPATSNPITMLVNPLQPVSVVVVASQNPACAGSNICFTATVTNGGSSPFYRWRVNGDNQGTNSPSFCYVPQNNDEIYCRVTSNATCASNNPSNSNKIYMTMIPNGTVSLTISASANPVCLGSSVTFTATPVNGGPSPVYQWKINGANAGTNSPSFSYTPANGDVVTCELVSNALCVSPNTATSNSITMIVSPLQPVSLSIVASANPVCQGSSVTLNAIPVNGGPSPSYQWKVNGATIGSNSPLLTYTPVNGDVVTCIMTSNAACAQGNPATSNSVTLTVNSSMPVSVSITASSNPACQGQQVCYTATPVNGGASPFFQWKVNGMNVGNNNPVFCYIPSSGDIVRCQLTSSYSCASGNPALSNPITVSFYPNLPVGVSIACSANPACEGVPVTFTATPTNGGASPTYQWKVNGNPAGGNNPTYSYIPSNGDIVICTLTSSVPCPINNPVTSNPVNMSVLVPVTASVAIAASSNPVCVGTSVTFIATPQNGGSAPVYQWYVNSLPYGGPSQTLSYTPVNGDVITCQMSSSMTCLTANPVTSNSIPMVVGTDFPVSIGIAASNNPSCHGQSVTFSATAVNGGVAPVFQWNVNSMNVGTNSPTYTYVPNNGDIIKCQVTSDYSCASGNPATSAPVTMVVNPNLPASVTISSSFNPACAGTEIIYSATPVNGGTSPSYQWKVNGSNAGANNPVFTYTPSNNDILTCHLTSSLVCVTGNPAVSNAIQMIVGSSFPLSITVSPSANPICTGTSVTFTAVPYYGGSSPVFQWKVNGTPVGGNSIYFTYFPADGDQVTCTLTSDLTCATGNPATSNTVTMNVLPVPVEVSIACSPTGPVCAGTQVTFTATPFNGGPNPTYIWKVNGNTSGTNSPVFIYPPSNGDIVTCVMTSNATCATGNTATSNPISMIVNPLMPVGISIAPLQSGPVCEGTLVTFTASPVNGGTDPAFQWKVNGANTGTNNPVFSYPPDDGDVVSCIMTSNAICATGNPAVSNGITMTVINVLTVGITIAADPPGDVCSGTLVFFHATVTNEGLSPEYHWKVNGVDFGSNDPDFYFIPENGDVVTCVLQSSIFCSQNNPAMSNEVAMTVHPLMPVHVAVTADPSGSVCEGTTVVYTAIPFNGGANPVFQWKVNGINEGNNHPEFTYIPGNGDLIVCELTSDAECATGNPAISAPVTMTVHPNLPVSLSVVSTPAGSVCEGTIVTFTASAVNEGTSPVYQWMVNGIISGLNDPVFSYIPVDGDKVQCTLVSSAVCATGNPATSNQIDMSVNPILPAAIFVTPSSNPVCEGTTVTFSAFTVNEGSSPAYQWKMNSLDAGGNAATFSYIPIHGDVVTCILTSSEICVSGNPAVSDPVSMIVYPNLIVSVSVEAEPPGTVCEGTIVNYTATAINGGSSPSYQWQINGTNAGSDQNTLLYPPEAGDIITCLLTSSVNCPVNNPSTSNPVVMNVNPVLPVSISISADPQGSICAGTPVTFTATAVNGGLSPVFQWYVNGIPEGTGDPVLIYVPSEADMISCVLTSSFSCTSGSPAYSNTIIAEVNPLHPVSLTIDASTNPVCEGTYVTFSATAANPGTTPVYQWKVNGADAGMNSPVFGYEPAHGDLVNCVLSSDVICPTGNPAFSDTISMTVNPNLPVSLTITADPAGAVCEGTTVAFTASPVNGGPAPAYQWYVNGIPHGNNNPVYSYIPATGETVSCVMQSTAICPTGNPASSNIVSMTVNPNYPVSITVSASANPVCEGMEVIFTGVPVNGGSSPSFQWKVNGISTGNDDPVFTRIPDNGDIITCDLVSSEICTTGNPAASSPVVMAVGPKPDVSFSLCVDPVTTTSAKPFRMKGGIPLGGTYSGPGVNSSTGFFDPSSAGTGNHLISYVYTNVTTCADTAWLTLAVQDPDPFVCGSPFTDPRDGKSYQTINIGSSCWFAVNLNYGQKIQSSSTQRDNCIVEKYCFNDDPANCTMLGGIYHWEELMQYTDEEYAQGLCPPGWHVPAEADWNSLFNLYSGPAYAGDNLKTGGSSGFNALLAGGFFKNRAWVFRDFGGFFWSSTSQGPMKAWAHGMNEENHGVSYYPSSRSNAYSVRCVKD